jgi:hypothetical protein
MLPHFLDSRLRDGGEVVSLTRRQTVTAERFQVKKKAVLVTGRGGL